MKVFIFPFGKISILESHIAEIIINDSVLLKKSDLETYHNFLKSNLQAPISVLINKENAYSYAFNAQLEMGILKAIEYRAVVNYSLSAEMATNILMNINKNSNWNIKLFRERTAALDWLRMNRNNKSAV